MKHALVLLAVIVSASAQDRTGTFNGEVMDRQCAQMQSHDNMMKTQGAKNAKECTLSCVKNGDKFALFDSNTNKVYPIEGDKKVRDYAGQRVKITGTYDGGAGVLHVKSIAAAGK